MSGNAVLGGLSNDTPIPVVGHPNPYPYGKVKDAVIYLGDAFYFKDDEVHLVKVKDTTGKKRLFRRESKLIQEITKGVFVHKKNIIKTEDGVLLDKTDPNTISVNGKPTRKEYAVEINGTYYLKSDPSLTKCCLSSGFILLREAIQLHPEYYSKKPMYVGKDQAINLVNIDGGHILRSDSRMYLDRDGNEVHCHRNFLDRENKIEVFLKFRDTTNPQLDRIDFGYMLQKDADYTVQCQELHGHRIHKAHLKEFLRIYNEVILVAAATATAELKAALKYSDDGPDENQAKIVKKVPVPFAGKQNIYTPTKMEHVISKTTKLTGGLKYTFGVEIETSQGMVPNEAAEKVMLKIVGDRSIGAGEYVTGLLHGDSGMELLEKQCKIISRYTLVDDRCGIHVHIGGLPTTKGVAEGDFGKRFCMDAIKLACQIEPEVFLTCPESRKTTLKHCHSIMRWKDINEENWKQYLAAYVFGPEEVWKAKPNQSLWSFSNYSYGSERHNKKVGVDNWCGGRYKWLNLVHILTKSRINTCEWRVFPGSTSFEKIYNYVMLSMAFVWFVENKPGRIAEGNVTLNEVLTTPFAKLNPELGQKLVAFYEGRKKKFNRKVESLYPEKIPAAIF